MAKQHSFGRASLARMRGVDQELVSVALVVITRVPFDLTIPKYGGLRTQPEQKLLFDDGKSRCDGTTKLSKHQQGLALDIVPYVKGRGVWDEDLLNYLAIYMYDEAMRQGVDLRWGGLFDGFYDGAHYQLGD